MLTAAEETQTRSRGLSSIDRKMVLRCPLAGGRQLMRGIWTEPRSWDRVVSLYPTSTADGSFNECGAKNPIPAP